MYHVLCWFIILFRLLSVIVPVYINFFDHKDLGNQLLQLCPKVMEHPVYKTTMGITAQGGGLLYFVAQCFRRFHYAERHL